MGVRIGSLEINETEKFRLISDSTYDWEEWRGPLGELVYISPSCERITGFSVQDFISQENFLATIIHPDDITDYQKNVSLSLIASTETSHLDFRIIRKNGEERWINQYCVPIYHANGTWMGRRISNRDITHRKQTEAELFQTKQQLEIILSNIATIVFGLDREGHLVYANQAAANAAGFQTPEQLIEYGLILDKFEIIDQENQPLSLMQLSVDEAVQSLSNSNLTIRYRRLDSKEFNWAILSGRPIFSELGVFEILVVIAQDITKLKQTQDELKESRDELEKRVDERTKELEQINQSLLLENAHRRNIEAALQQERDFSRSIIQTAQVGLLVLDKEGKILQINPFLEQISGYTLDEVKFKDWFQTFLLPEDQEVTRTLFLRAIEDIHTYGNITPIRTKDGQIRLIEWYDKTLKDKNGDLQGLLSIGQDVTKRKEYERKVLRNATQAEALANITSRINADLDLKSVLNSICEVLVHATPAMETAVIMLRDDELDEVKFAAGYGQNLEYRFSLNPVPLSIYQEDLIKHGTLTVIPDIQVLGDYPNLEIAHTIHARTTISVVMVHHERIVGVITLVSLAQPYTPSEEEISFIQAIANHATIAIANARLFEQVSENRKRMQSLSQRLVKIQESERRNISRELHDEIGQELTSLILLIEVIKNTCQRHDTPNQLTYQKLENAQDLVNIVLRQIRELALDLRPGMLDDLGLLPALLMHFDRFTQQTDIKVLFKHSGIDRRFSGEIETTSFRIIQEALTNVARHAKVRQANVRIWIEENNLNIQIQDDGAGFDREEIINNSNSIGLLGMQERATLCGGRLDIEAQPGLGTCLTVEIPLNEEVQENKYGLKNTFSR